MVNHVFVPYQKGAVLTKTAKKRRIFHWKQAPENDENDENGGCDSGKGIV